MVSQAFRELKFYYEKIKQNLNTDSIWETFHELVRQVGDRIQVKLSFGGKR